jgi:hypothetical protein
MAKLIIATILACLLMAIPLPAQSGDAPAPPATND